MLVRLQRRWNRHDILVRADGHRVGASLALRRDDGQDREEIADVPFEIDAQVPIDVAVETSVWIGSDWFPATGPARTGGIFSGGAPNDSL